MGYNNLQTQDLINIPGGTYTVTVTDGAGCWLYYTRYKYFISGFNFDYIYNHTYRMQWRPNRKCNSSGNGRYKIHTYIWSDGSTNATAVNLANEIYTVTVTDQHNCSKSVTVNIPSTLQLLHLFRHSKMSLAMVIQPDQYKLRSGRTPHDLSLD
ncbi:MAG: hypothetical protein R2847_03455 [Bacteroidia bacterium]